MLEMLAKKNSKTELQMGFKFCFLLLLSSLSRRCLVYSLVCSVEGELWKTVV